MLEQENARLKRAVADLTLDKLILKEAVAGKLVSPERRRRCVSHVMERYPVSDTPGLQGLGPVAHEPALQSDHRGGGRSVDGGDHRVWLVSTAVMAIAG